MKILYKRFFVYAVVFMSFVPSAYGANAILVTQPAYHSMNFYVYKPINVSNEFFATYDGYLVYKDSQCVWNYASFEKSGIKKTGYVVGSVIPSVVNLKPYDAKISSVNPVFTKLQIKPAGTRIKPNESISMKISTPDVLKVDVTPITKPEAVSKKSQRIVYTPPLSNFEIYKPGFYTANAADWTQNSNFMAISKWQNSIDRIGVLDKPATPIAWKGDCPDVIYAWTGMQWRQMLARGKHVSALSTIKRENYSLIVHTNKLNALSWTDDDSYVLSQYALMWGYQWLGQILINKEY